MKKIAAPAERAFWDSSGVVLLCANQRSTATARRIRAGTGPTAMWWGTPLEVTSALQRLHRERFLSSAELSTSLQRLSALSRSVPSRSRPHQSVRVLAATVLERHDLRAADALQLAAALVLCREHPRGRAFVCFDAKLAGAADAEGFTLSFNVAGAAPFDRRSGRSARSGELERVEVFVLADANGLGQRLDERPRRPTRTPRQELVEARPGR